MANIVPPSCINGAARFASRTNEWTETSIALRKIVDRAVYEPAPDRFAGTSGDRMHDDVETVPFALDTFEYRLQLARYGDVERHEDGRLQPSRHGLHVRAWPFVHVRDRELGTHLVERTCATVRDRVLVRDADDQRLAAVEKGPVHRGHLRCHRMHLRIG